MSIDRVRLVHDWLIAAAPTAAKIGCTPAAIVAQAILESSWGQAAIGNNIFGIRADASWQGAKRLVHTWEHENGVDVPQDGWFRDYPTLADSFADHFAFLAKWPRYRDAGVFDTDNTKSDEDYFRALQRAGYATDPNYASALTGVLHTVQSLAGIPVAPRAVLMQGDHGDDVRAIQTALTELGFPCVADGIFGVGTYATVRAFQRGRGLVIDGVVGPKTRAALGL